MESQEFPSLAQLASDLSHKVSSSACGEADSAHVDWQPLVSFAEAHYKTLAAQASAANTVLPVWQCYTQEHTELQRSSGDGRLADLKSALELVDRTFPRSIHQREFHDAFTASCIRNIYREEYSANHLRILEENGWSECRQEVFICCPRRFGKTFAVAMFVAAYAWTQAGQTQCIFSPSRRQSKMLLDSIKKFVCLFEGAESRILKYNQEELWLKGPSGDPNDVRKVCSYPSKVSIGAKYRRARAGSFPPLPSYFFFQQVGCSGSWPRDPGRVYPAALTA
jgi:hypothetical protein